MADLAPSVDCGGVACCKLAFGMFCLGGDNLEKSEGSLGPLTQLFVCSFLFFFFFFFFNLMADIAAQIITTAADNNMKAPE